MSSSASNPTSMMWFALHHTRDSAETFLKDKAHGEWKIITLYPIRTLGDLRLPDAVGYLVVPVDFDPLAYQ